MTRIILLLAILAGFKSASYAVPTDTTRNFLTDTTRATFHLQLTTITQYHPAFNAAYNGKNSLDPNAEEATSVTSTIFVGVKLWQGASVYFNPELAGGNGLSSVTGIAGFPNGETPRIGDPAPTITIARAYVQQAIGLPSDGTDHIPDDQNNIAQDLPKNRIMLTIGKFALTDFFDGNSYSHDPRTQFENWALMDDGAWDYPANTHGYTLAVADEINSWPIGRFGSARQRNQRRLTVKP